MVMNDALSEKPEDIRQAMIWSKELAARRKKSDILTKELLKKLTPEFMKQLSERVIAH